MREPSSMSWFEWWVANLLQGSVGALIGLLGLFAVFWFTVRHERSLEAFSMAEHDKRLEREHPQSPLLRSSKRATRSNGRLLILIDMPNGGQSISADFRSTCQNGGLGISADSDVCPGGRHAPEG